MVEELQLKCAKRRCKTLEMAVEAVEIQEQYTGKAIQVAQTEENETVTFLKIMGDKLEALLGEIKEDREQKKSGPAEGSPQERKRWTWNVTPPTRKGIL